MTPELYQCIRDVYQEACEFSGDARQEVVMRLCGDDEVLRREVQSLLRHHDDRPDALDDAHLGLGRELLESGGGRLASACPEPQRIGPYAIIRLLGSGGMGTVYEAEQLSPIRRLVALKVIKPGMDTSEILARFERERQALALMDHPHIARVLDAGATDAGRPYIVMELCPGEPITEFCDARHLRIPARLALFVQVCRAVQHAHEKGIIHRDLKPSNILVHESHDVTQRPGGEGTAVRGGGAGRSAAAVAIPKIIDFGIAKATAGSLTDWTLHTQQQQLVGTPEYMSPEQAEGSRDIDTRSDVYSLGVLLYQLLTGRTLFSSPRWSSPSEMQRVIREVDPLRPSSRVRTATRRQRCGSDDLPRAWPEAPAILVRALRGDLDWIAMKAIAKERTRRYESAGALAADVSRCLAGDVVLAAPPSTSYRLRKFIRRHRALAYGLSAVITALIVGLAGTLWQAGVAQREARLARQAEADAEKIAEFQAHMLSEIDPSQVGERLLGEMRRQYAGAMQHDGIPESQRVSLAAQFEEHLHGLNATDLATDMIDSTILKPAIAAIQLRLAAQPAVEASLQQTLANVYRSLGRYADAMPLQQRALGTRIRLLGKQHHDTLASMYAMGTLLHQRGDTAAAEELLRDTLVRCRAALGSNDATTLATLTALGGVFRVQGHLLDTEACWREVLDRRRRTLGDLDPATMLSINNMGYVLQEQGKLDQAEHYYHEALEKRRRVLGPDHPDTLTSLNFMGYLLRAQHRLDEAAPYWREALEKRRRILGEFHPNTLTSIANMGELLRDQGRPAEAEPLLREALQKRRRVLGEHHTLTVQSTEILAKLLKSEGRLAEADLLGHEPDHDRR